MIERKSQSGRVRLAAPLLAFALLVASTGPVAHASESFDEAITAFDEAIAANDPAAPGFTKAYRIWSALAEGGDNRSLYHLGVMNFYGLGGAVFDHQLAVDRMKRSAQGGYHVAQSFMGVLSENGDNVIVRKNAGDALAWYTKGAEGGHCVSVRRLAQAYEKGELGLEKDVDQAGRWTAKLASCSRR